jgi:5-methylcytosine-specific restriction protein A
VHARARDAGRPNADVRKLYTTDRWRRLRAQVLADEPLCVDSAARGVLEPSTTADHITPHRGDVALFWDRGNLQALCHACHSRKTQAGG